MVSDAQREIFNRCVWPHAEVVLRMARLLLRDMASADDLAQEAFLRAFRFIDRFQEGTDGKAWILAILRNARVDLLRKSGREIPQLSLDAMDLDVAATSSPAVVNEGRMGSAEAILEAFGDEEVIHALQALPEEIRWTLLLVDVEGMDHKDASAVLDVPVGTVKSRAHRGRAMLKTILMPLAVDRGLVEEMPKGSSGQRDPRK